MAANRELLHIGPKHGDVLRVDLKSLDLSTDAIIAGPPCPPFSAIGARLCEVDPRSSVFVSVALWAVYLAVHGRLSWWCFENVEGICTRKRGADASFAEWCTGLL